MRSYIKAFKGKLLEEHEGKAKKNKQKKGKKKASGFGSAAGGNASRVCGDAATSDGDRYTLQ